MSKAPALMKSQGVREIVNNSTLDNEIVDILKEILGFFKSLGEGVQASARFLVGNWQILIIGVVSLFILSKKI